MIITSGNSKVMECWRKGEKIMKGRSPATATRAMPEGTAARLVELGCCLEYLEKAGRLVRVHSAVSSKHELAPCD
jgi:hypothetical protein